jgi:hypothetical protein
MCYTALLHRLKQCILCVYPAISSLTDDFQNQGRRPLADAGGAELHLGVHAVEAKPEMTAATAEGTLRSDTTRSVGDIPAHRSQHLVVWHENGLHLHLRHAGQALQVYPDGVVFVVVAGGAEVHVPAV